MSRLIDADKLEPDTEWNDYDDDFRAEVEQMDFDFGDFYDNTDSIVRMVLQVIDKYKTER
ncbi:hypothetical protein [Lachnospira multipara]|uniref:hypothetical protein n=1 Tax=Lachnospira multipara TaxID=28051 RepID=UPI0004288281|nr:hypothetical protein [Lachnospira multipara]